ncbi:MAG: hypothetical protein A2622_08565 [Bdellovibrionales bacterium RIFCSPHIGHO2_01_FULL_40_29]|nr:MAG: hypothetical protein A2622_08565 [Bdellovibrionales bacterium RIFCSPHIGHO2_01_FULL_40_29]OFZ35541.1 MAG: hypothetical protein A3D17_07800 [Bdellovibrionales bacterium RIFCSPHIGHO2_02_FULL_40_15]
MDSCENNDLVVFSHLRWNFVFQRPQHLMSRFAKKRRVFYFEEPIFEDVSFPRIHTHQSEEGVFVVTPFLPQAFLKLNYQAVLATLLDELLMARYIHNFNIWYFTPMALTFSRHLSPKRIVFDIIDELVHFADAPPLLKELENELLMKADLVFTAGHSLFEAKKNRHHNIHAFPSSVDKIHFAQARLKPTDPMDQIKISRPRVGYFGAIDDRVDMVLLAEMARLRPDIQFILIGPIVKANPETLPQADNIHYLGQKSYRELPNYIAHWDCAMIPFVLNDSTQYINPTKTLEFLAAGKPVVSTAIMDVIYPYGENNLVHVAESATQFIDYIELALLERRNIKWQLQVDSLLAEVSWDNTWQKMTALELLPTTSIESPNTEFFYQMNSTL